MKKNTPNTVILMLVCAIVVAGEVLRAGNLIEVTEDEAKDLLHRGKAVVHDHDPESDQAVTASNAAAGGEQPDAGDQADASDAPDVAAGADTSTGDDARHAAENPPAGNDKAAAKAAAKSK